MKTNKVCMAIALILSGAMISGSAYALKPGCTAPPCGGGGGEPEPTQGNNLSFPAIAVDEYPITPITETLFNVPYTGDYPGLTAAEIAGLEASGPWYPQKTAGNTWQADYENAVGPVEVTYVDWGDNVESNNPKVRRPFRLEVQLYKQLNAWGAENPSYMTGYNMAVLEYPSSANELQGTNKITYEGNFATVVSPRWGLRIQYCGDAIPDNLYWNGERWLSPTASCSDVPVSFAVELNVGGKLIFGASEGGWKPDRLGSYRITFFGLPGDHQSNLSLRAAEIGNYEDFAVQPPPASIAPEADEGGAATPVVDSVNNLSYVDVKVVSGGGGSGGSKPPSAGE